MVPEDAAQHLASLFQGRQRAFEFVDQPAQRLPVFPVAELMGHLGIGEELLGQHALAAGDVDKGAVGGGIDEEGIKQPQRQHCPGGGDEQGQTNFVCRRQSHGMARAQKRANADLPWRINTNTARVCIGRASTYLRRTVNSAHPGAPWVPSPRGSRERLPRMRAGVALFCISRRDMSVRRNGAFSAALTA